MKRRIASIVMAGIMTLSMMGCGSASPAPTTDTGSANTDTKTETAQTTEETKTEDTTETAAASTDEPITLNMWCIATESDSNRHAYEAAIAEMAEKYPNITLNWEAFENQSYKTKIKAAVSANEMPDIFFTWSCAFLGDFVDADKVYCLDDIYPEFASELPENMLGNTT